MNSSVPLVSPPLITAALTRIATTTPTIAQNSVVLKACLVSVVRRRIRPSRRIGSVRTAPGLVPASIDAVSLSFDVLAWAVQGDRRSLSPLCSQTGWQVASRYGEQCCLASARLPSSETSETDRSVYLLELLLAGEMLSGKTVTDSSRPESVVDEIV